MTSQQDNTSRLTLGTRDLVNIGVFTAIYYFVTFLGGMMGIISPIGMFAGFTLSTIIGGTVIMLFMAKTHVMGAMTILGLIIGILMLATGHFWGTVPLCAGLGFVADLIVRAGHYRSRGHNIAAYGLFQLWLIGPFAPLFINTTAYYEDMRGSMGATYANQMSQIFTPWVVAAFIVILCFVGLLGAWIGTKLIDRHFAKAGMVS
ncbi:MptD family putative ECF transporter S component [Bifidobacterium psychraerophilum]|jgi:energy-coupling factor transport system substrate-specific component|uniref:Permease n=1 Tax=Bifidobacterium psychraerophilum TaxID=218140 RepID=A0A087CCU3_9BIFI|nr:MptD family putative ECF transporter S component [Bifidobacterium psychraerophilum]KFI81093.1 permease [Bifidobacterium psychraerophilum]MCI1660223.1 MptD family putative ECF transporter S component [Bifidobacterium psychraerophilum]MCI1803900.1 MptD family putative ECF transporter S component [Bifidobacterium psychraerophilum]MCI2175802.1 MptD family putative ECF transporter S component [Bifidobacterium psychraerophilum]MCI2182470.1 MptD family putative ECF transporter S component [Bifidob